MSLDPKINIHIFENLFKLFADITEYETVKLFPWKQHVVVLKEGARFKTIKISRKLCSVRYLTNLIDRTCL